MKNINIIVPQYQSSLCVDNCLYCGFKKTNKLINRKRLDDDDFIKEIELLLSWGYRTIEFVYASDRYFNASRIAKRIDVAKNIARKQGFEIKIGLNAEPFDYDGYKTLYNAGLDFFVLWMETYNKEKYKMWHGTKTPKGNFDYRYETYQRAIEAGLKNYGMGILFGLADWEEDTQSLINHGNELTKDYGVSPYIVGVPRVKRANCVQLNSEFQIVSDVDFIKAVRNYKLAFPETMIFLNTRETFEMNVELCSENDLFTIDCGTFPGAYLRPSILKNDTEQFHTVQYNREKAILEFKENKLNPVFEW